MKYTAPRLLFIFRKYLPVVHTDVFHCPRPYFLENQLYVEWVRDGLGRYSSLDLLFPSKD